MKPIHTGRALFILFSILTTTGYSQEYKSNLTEFYESSGLLNKSANILSIKDAVKLALLNNHGIAADLLEIDALKMVSLQQGYLPNPELGIEIENFLGGGTFDGFKGSEITLAISQNILLAGKISKRTKLSELETELKYYNYEMRRLEIITDVRKRFNTINLLNELISKQEELHSTAASFYEKVIMLSENGHSSKADIIKAYLTMSKLNLELGRSSRMLESSIQQLSQLLGVNDLNNFEFINEETDGIEIPAYNEIIGLVSNNPELVMNTNVLKRDDMNILYQESLAIPDLSVGLGIRRINETNDNALVAGISFALPLFNANKGHIEEAYIKKDRNKSLYDLEKLKLQQSLTEAYNKMANNTSSIKMLTEDIIPQAERAVIILEDGYKEGRYTLLEVLDSQRTLLELEIEYFNAVMEYNNNLFEIEKIIGQSLTGISREKHNNE